MIKFDSNCCVAQKYSTAMMLSLLQANVSPIDSEEMSVPLVGGAPRQWPQTHCLSEDACVAPGDLSR